MIDIQQQWCLQIDVTNACTRRCSNCTRLIGQVQEPFYMDLETYEAAIVQLADFPAKSPPAADEMFKRLANKVVGMIGGEPLLHPKFKDLCLLAEKHVPDRRHRGLWTGLRWESTQYAHLIRRVFGYINNNTHADAFHTPILTAISDLVEDPVKRQILIGQCWLQRLWSGTVTPKGLFFCEVAGAMDTLFDGPGGLPIEKGCWRRPIKDFQSQIDQWCNRCGVPLNLKGRRDSEEIDDVTQSNLAILPNKSRCRMYAKQLSQAIIDPWRYLR